MCVETVGITIKHQQLVPQICAENKAAKFVHLGAGLADAGGFRVIQNVASGIADGNRDYRARFTHQLLKFVSEAGVVIDIAVALDCAAGGAYRKTPDGFSAPQADLELAINFVRKVHSGDGDHDSSHYHQRPKSEPRLEVQGISSSLPEVPRPSRSR